MYSLGTWRLREPMHVRNTRMLDLAALSVTIIDLFISDYFYFVFFFSFSIFFK